MFKKLIVGLLVITVVGGATAALIDSPDTNAEVVLIPSATPQPEVVETAITQPVQASLDNVGEVWSGSGTILELTTVGMTLALDSGSEVFVELGSPSYWQAQNVPLNPGAVVTVDGFFNGDSYHARTVTTSTGAILAVRDEAGQPLWSGGNTNGNTNGNGSGEAGDVGQAQVSADQWVTVEGTVTALTNNGLVVQPPDGQTLSISFGRADFWKDQAVSFAAGDAISMLGFWQGSQFSPGQVTKTATGERILLRDPNGRPLWAGPGREQASGTNSQGNGGNGNGNGGQGNSNGGQGNGGNGSGGQGNGNGGQGQNTAPQLGATATAAAGQ